MVSSFLALRPPSSFVTLTMLGRAEVEALAVGMSGDDFVRGIEPA
jgi:hypothetical protein